MSLDLKDYFLATPMEQPEYMKVLLKYFPTNIQTKYDLRNKVTLNGYRTHFCVRMQCRQMSDE